MLFNLVFRVLRLHGPIAHIANKTDYVVGRAWIWFKYRLIVTPIRLLGNVALDIACCNDGTDKHFDYWFNLSKKIYAIKNSL